MSKRYRKDFTDRTVRDIAVVSAVTLLLGVVFDMTARQVAFAALLTLNLIMIPRTITALAPRIRRIRA